MKKTKGFVSEFKTFLTRGNVIDLAVGVIIGGAFQAIVNSLVNDIFMPIMGFFTKGIDFTSKFATFDGKVYESIEAAQEAGVAVLTYGNFISAIINFVIMAFVIFFLVKTINKITAKAKKTEEEIVPTTKLCQFCKSEISIEATKCAFCTSDVSEE